MSKLTGRFRFRKSFFGRLILQVEYEKYHMDDDCGFGYYEEWYTKHWRDAKPSDLSPMCHGHLSRLAALEARTIVFNSPLVVDSLRG